MHHCDRIRLPVTLWLSAAATLAGLIAVSPAAARPAPVSACGPVYSLGWQNNIGTPGVNAHVWSLEGVDATSSLGPALYACGDFTMAGGSVASYVAKWDGSGWSPLVGPFGEGLGYECEDIRLGPDDRLYMAGAFSTAGGHLVNFVTAWDGTDFSPVNTGLDNLAIGLEFHDAGGGTMLWLGGYFENANGQVGDQLSMITSWDGTFWFIYGPGAGDFGADAPVWELREWDDGTGNTLYVSGQFSTITGNSANRIAKLSGATFVPLAGGLTITGGSGVPVDSLMPYDDGTGEKLYAVGWIDHADGIPVRNIAAWDGSSWSDVGNGTNGPLEGLAVVDVDDGSKLYVVGYQTAAGLGLGRVNANGIVSWDGTDWGRLLGGLTPINSFDHGMFAEEWNGCLYAGGQFDFAGSLPASNIARWCCGISFLAASYNVDIPKRFLVDAEFTDDGDGLPETLRCNETDFALGSGSSLTACGIAVRVGTAGVDTMDLSDLPVGALVFAGAGNDQIRGTRFDDVIYGGPGDDVIDADDGADRIMADPGNDDLDGGDGADELAGGEGDDQVAGGNGDDVLAGNQGNDLIDGGRGDDLVEGAEQITQDVLQSSCLLRLAGGAARVAKAQATIQRRCLRDAHRGIVADADTCIAGDPQGKIASATATLDSTRAENCGVEPDIAFSSVATIAGASVAETRDVVHDLLGMDADAAVAAAAEVEGGAACQLRLVAIAAKLLAGETLAFNKCAKERLTAGPVVVGAPFDSCFEAMAATPSNKLEHLTAKLTDTIVQRCPTGSLGTLFPGTCAAAADLTVCTVERALCRACLMLNARDQTSHDCDLLDDAIADASCVP